MKERTQLEWLRSDVEEVRRVLDEHPQVFEALADVRDPDRHAKYLVVAELTWRIWTHAMAVEVLLREDLYTPALIIQRAMFDAFVTLGYVVKHPKSQDEAVILLAYSYLRDLRHFPTQTDLVREYTDVLNRMPKRLVNTAKARAKERPRTWSGKSIKQMAEAAGVRGYDPGYTHMSGEAHASAMGRHIRTTRHGDMMNLEAGRRTTDKEVQASANYARRFLHVSFKTLWDVFGGPKITIRSENPDEWLAKQTGRAAT